MPNNIAPFGYNITNIATMARKAPIKTASLIYDPQASN